MKKRHNPGEPDTTPESRRIFLIADLHLDHANIIKYCKRPFASAGEMNEALIKNWNSTVSQGDTVYFLGDLAFGKGSRKTDYWLEKLHGRIIFIKGNHDRSKNIGFFDALVLDYFGRKFLLTHYPANVPAHWKGWVIHGHAHNNHLKDYPFINGKRRTINVGAELINYTPLDIGLLFKLDFERVVFMENLNSEPVGRKQRIAGKPCKKRSLESN